MALIPPVHEGEIHRSPHIGRGAVISQVLSHDLAGEAVDYGKEVCFSVFSMNVDVLDGHLPDLIRCIYMNNELRAITVNPKQIVI